jgi:hypothetical protein
MDAILAGIIVEALVVVAVVAIVIAAFYFDREVKLGTGSVLV